MSLTRKQATETALTLVSEHLTDLVDPAYEMDDWIDRKLCEQHCPDGDCHRVEEDAEAELAAVRQVIGETVAYLREVLVSRLAEATR